MIEEIKALITGLDHMDKGMKKKQLIELQTCKELLSGWDFEQMIEQLQERDVEDAYINHDLDRKVIEQANEQYDMANPIDVKRWRASMSDKMIEKKKSKSNKTNEVMSKPVKNKPVKNKPIKNMNKRGSKSANVRVKKS